VPIDARIGAEQVGRQRGKLLRAGVWNIRWSLSKDERGGPAGLSRSICWWKATKLKIGWEAGIRARSRQARSAGAPCLKPCRPA